MKRSFFFLLMLLSVAMFSSRSYAVFIYDITEFTQSNETNTFIDTFSDGIEPPSGSNSGSDYNVLAWSSSTTFGVNRESGGLLELNSDDAEIGIDGDNLIGAYLTDPDYFFSPDAGGSVKGAFEVNNGYFTNTAFGIAIDNFDSTFGLPSTLEDAVMGIYTDPLGKIIALWGDNTTTSELDITGDLTGITEITMLLELNTLNQVSANFDYGSDGSYDLIFDNYKTMSFTPDDSNDVFSGEFVALEFASIPVPSTVFLLGSGLAWLGLMRKKKPNTSF